MIKKYNLKDINIDELLVKEKEVEANVDDVVSKIIDDVINYGDVALIDYTAKFDKVKLDCLQVPEEEIDQAFNNMDEYFLQTLKLASENITAFHKEQLHKNFYITKKNGAIMGQKYTPVEKAGIYVPGGTASYPSTVLMDAIPAKIAGVSEIIMVTPPDKNGKIKDEILAAAKIAGVTKIFKVGGAQSIAALAHGTKSIPKVDKIVGPGNIFVATAKRMVYGMVSIDMIAGPSDVLVIADENANAKHIAADMLAQAEHDKLATAILVTTNDNLANLVTEELEIQVEKLARCEIAKYSIEHTGKIIVVDNLMEAVEVCNKIAPEHLEICTKDPFSLLDHVKNAGSIFLGNNTPEALGDYLAGPNHTLPTNGTARFSNPLSVDDFIKKSSFLYYPEDALLNVKDRVCDFAMREGLQAHANSIAIRFEDDKGI